ncbi:MAG: helix-turn-helix transcriptional regulator [Psychroserpens sp.]|nr:helix-turn-helix transcriptional regulator [Psychroserpens sp.]MBO6653467.1 helix-turn-helix transcriptional regulator [Psychroserpens sp.]MBO6680505.1 helix-turn-helix transcriptional regulator [Psychroserpens sp.]MBO6750536.1 helix-turn-helix transcriptional regulator [Psychroserpens sp.]MBO6915019.1 helix-turn-helix transcriptional regulator [Psychroserpens sp.]
MHRFKKVGDYHKFANLGAPEHPLISLVDYSQVSYPSHITDMKWTQDYYTIGLKRNIPYKFYYGQQAYDFDEGVMTFIAPKQVLSLGDNPNIQGSPTGFLLLVHPDFLWNSSLAKQIKQYGFFDYAINEALFLSEKEEQRMIEILKNIEKEYQSNIDKFSQKIVLSQLELLLNYAERFYERQFITRKITNHRVLEQLESYLESCFKDADLVDKGLPTVQGVSEQLHLSPNYLSNLLKSLTGQSTQQHIHDKLIEKAKLDLSSTNQSVSEIAYQLGFEQPASFSKLFKAKTEMSPIEFRRSFN